MRTDRQEGVAQFLLKWTPRAIAVFVGGYYGLGIAYEFGLMAVIDRYAIQLLKHFVGYAGVGALMPTVQWHAAIGVRIGMGLGTGLIYDVIERSAVYCCASLKRIS
jgi:hypothetical protein